jgi:hypothetical protein
VVLILPRITKYGRYHFRFEKNRSKKEEAIEEMKALGWKWCVSLNRRGRDPACFPTALALLLVKAVRSGRRLAGKSKSNDVMNPQTQQQKGFLVQRLPLYESSDLENEALDALEDNTRTPPPDQAAFRIDYAAWVRTHTDRTRRIIHDLMMGHRTLDVSNKFGLTAGRISQMRKELCLDWQRFCDEFPSSDAQ